MKFSHFWFSWIVAFSLLAGLGASQPPWLTWQRKVDTQVLNELTRGQSEFLIVVKQQPDLSGAAKLATKREKGRYVYQILTANAARTQPQVLSSLKEMGVAYRSFWIANVIWARGDAKTVQTLAQRTDVGQIVANPRVLLDKPERVADLAASLAATGARRNQWNIEKVGAPQVWAAGYTGEGVVVGGQDTGYQWDHPILKNSYLGWDGTTVDHNYHWHDAIHADDPNTTAGNPCGFDVLAPCDDEGHGTHTMGISVGSDGYGMAPGARWIACRNMEEGWGTPASYIECYQWFLAPTDLNNQNPDPDLAPAVINNSWGCPQAEGCTTPEVLLAAVQAVRAAGILTVHSAGNSGANGCSTVNEPAAIYDESFSVGNVDTVDAIAMNSSRGPVTIDGSNRLKPDVTAPGSNVTSSYTTSSYRALSGTSMAAPHVAGLVALLISANPDLAGDVDRLEQIIRSTALPLTTSESCGGTAGQSPNNAYGWGRIDAWEAFLQSGVSVNFLYLPVIQN